MNFKGEVCSSSRFFNGSARNMDEFKSSTTKFGRTILDFEPLDSQIAGAVKTLMTADFKRRVYMEEQQAQDDNRFLKGRHIAYILMIIVRSAEHAKLFFASTTD